MTAKDIQTRARSSAMVNKTAMQRIEFMFLTIVLLAVCLFGAAGCAHEPTTADLQKVYSDTSLTPEQREAKIDAMTPDPVVLQYEQMIPYVAIGIVLLIIGVVLKKKTDASSLAAAGSTPGGGRAAPKPSQTAPKPAQKQAAKTPSKPVPSASKPTQKPKRGDKSKAAPAGPPPGYAARIQEQVKQEQKLPETQQEIDAIPESERAASYFSSRPLPVSALQQIEVLVGHEPKTVYATAQEADAIRAGSVPRVRAFTVSGRTIPWYEWELYSPYTHYSILSSRDWTGLSNGVVACWLKAENCNPSLWGYIPSEEPDDNVALADYAVGIEGFDDEPAAIEATPADHPEDE